MERKLKRVLSSSRRASLATEGADVGRVRPRSEVFTSKGAVENENNSITDKIANLSKFYQDLPRVFPSEQQYVVEHPAVIGDEKTARGGILTTKERVTNEISCDAITTTNTGACEHGLPENTDSDGNNGRLVQVSSYVWNVRCRGEPYALHVAASKEQETICECDAELSKHPYKGDESCRRLNDVIMPERDNQYRPPRRGDYSHQEPNHYHEYRYKPRTYDDYHEEYYHHHHQRAVAAASHVKKYGASPIAEEEEEFYEEDSRKVGLTSVANIKEVLHESDPQFSSRRLSVHMWHGDECKDLSARNMDQDHHQGPMSIDPSRHHKSEQQLYSLQPPPGGHHGHGHHGHHGKRHGGHKHRNSSAHSSVAHHKSHHYKEMQLTIDHDSMYEPPTRRREIEDASSDKKNQSLSFRWQVITSDKVSCVTRVTRIP